MAARVIQGFFSQPRAVQAAPAATARIAPPPTAFGPSVRPGPPPSAAHPLPVAAQRSAAFASAAVQAQPINPVQLGIDRGGGQPLPATLRGPMESLFGTDFGAVRVHVGQQAERLGAHAFAIGNDLYFAPGRWRPESPEGRRLLGHELAHVVQQRQGRVRNPLGHGVAVVQDRALEAEADRMGERAAAASAPLGAAQANAMAPARWEPQERFRGIQLSGNGKPVRRTRSQASDDESSDDDDGSSSDGSSLSDDDRSSSSSSSDGTVFHPTSPPPPNSASKAVTAAAAASSSSAGTQGFNPFVRAESFDPNASDTDSEAAGPHSNKSFNHTKRKGRAFAGGQSRTKRKADKSREVARVNHYVAPGLLPNLAADATKIRDAVKDKRSRGATTLLCVLLLNERNKFVKYCYTNHDNTVRAEIRDEANRLGYSVVSSPQSHAEGELISYMHTHPKRRLVAMGCDKPHCAECMRLMRGYFKSFASQSSTDDARYKNYYMPEVLKEATGLSDRPLPAKKPAEKIDGAYQPTPAQASAFPAGANLVRIAPDGNCLFASIVAAGHFVGSVQDLRRTVAAQIRVGTITANGFVTADLREYYASQIEMNGMYNNMAGDAAPLLIAEALGLTIMIMQSNGNVVQVGAGTKGTVWLVRVTQPLEHFHLLRLP